MLLRRFLSVFFLLFLCAAGAQAQVVDKVILRADNFILLRSELEVGVMQAKQNLKDPAKANEAELRCKVFEQLALTKMMLAKANIDSVVVKDEEVDRELDDRLAYMVQAMGGRDKLEAQYRKSVEQFKIELRPQIREQLVVRKMQGKISEDVKITPAQVRRYFNSVPKDSLPFFSTQVEIGQIVRHFKPGRVRRGAARQKANDLRERILKGDDFDLMAKLYSQDPGSGAQGGKIMGIQRGQMVPEFEAAALSLKKGETSPVVESQFGFHIVQLLDKRGNEYDARHILIRPEADIDDQNEAFRFLDSLRTAIVRDSISFDKAANKFSDDPQTKNSGGFLLDASGSSRINTEDLDPKLFFTIDTMKLGNISRPVAYQDEQGKGGFRILYYKSRVMPHEANLKDDYQRIQAAALQQKKIKAMRDWVKRSKNEVSLIIDPEFQGCKLFEEANF